MNSISLKRHSIETIKQTSAERALNNPENVYYVVPNYGYSSCESRENQLSQSRRNESKILIKNQKEESIMQSTLTEFEKLAKLNRLKSEETNRV